MLSAAAGKIRIILTNLHIHKIPFLKPETHLVVLTHKKQTTFVKNQNRGGRKWVCYKYSDRKRRGKVKVPPLYKVRIMERKAERVPYNSHPVLHGQEIRMRAGGRKIDRSDASGETRQQRKRNVRITPQRGWRPARAAAFTWP